MAGSTEESGEGQSPGDRERQSLGRSMPAWRAACCPYFESSSVMMVRMGRRFMPPMQELLHMKL